jgi:polysaccharide export outer membrane protein
MKDRLLDYLPPRLAAPVAAGLLLGLLWFSTLGLRDRSASSSARIPPLPGVIGSSDRLPPGGERGVAPAVSAATASTPFERKAELPRATLLSAAPAYGAKVGDAESLPTAGPSLGKDVPGVPSLLPELLVRESPPERQAAEPVLESDGRPLPPSDTSEALAEPSGEVSRSVAPTGSSRRGRSWNLELIAREADAHSRRAFELAARTAYFSARSEFVMALRLIAQGLDEDGQTTAHRQALAMGLIALEEADDFAPSGAGLGADLDLPEMIRRHRTPVLRGTPVENLTSLAAMESYLSFSQQQLAVAAGGEVAGSMALYGLGKLHKELGNRRTTAIRAALPKSMVFYQAALLAMPRNYMAANDLGVLLAQGGRHEDARMVFERSAVIHQSSTGWRNLGLVLWQLGQTDLSRQAHRNFLLCIEAESGPGGERVQRSVPQVQWVDPATFADSNRGRRAADQAKRPETPPETPGRPSAFRTSAAGQATSAVQLCQALGPAAPCNICGVDCSDCDRCGNRGWESLRAIAWQAYAQGEYVGHQRMAHVSEYRLRVDDELDLVYRLTRDEQTEPYRLNVGDEIRVESFTDPELNRDLLIQPDGTITLRLLGQVRATGRTVSQLTEDLDLVYQKYYKVPAITVTPLKVNTKLEDLRASVDRRQGFGGQNRLAKITPEGSISLPAIGSVNAQGLTLSELQHELNEHYRAEVKGIEVIPVLVQRAPRFVYVLGEVAAPGRFELTGPTTVLQAIAMAGSWNVGARLRQIVVFRRGDDWRLLATVLDLDKALHGKQPCPAGEIWLSDSDVVIVPKSPILVADDFIELVFTRGIYGVFPIGATLNFSKLSSL